MKTLSKCLILNVNTKALHDVEDAKLVHQFMAYGLIQHARDICETYNIASEGVHVNYVPIDETLGEEYDLFGAIELIVLDSFFPPARNFVEEGLFQARRGHVNITGSISINFNTVFLNTGTVMITQEVFQP